MTDYDWLTALEGDALQLLDEAGVDEGAARAVLADPEGWGIGECIKDSGMERATASLVAEVVLGCIHSLILDGIDVAHEDNPTMHQAATSIANDWFDRAYDRLGRLDSINPNPTTKE